MPRNNLMHHTPTRVSESCDFPYGSHCCLLYNDEPQRRASVSTYVQSALKKGDRFLYVTDNDPCSISQWLDHPEKLSTIRSRQFSIQSAEQIYCPCGLFEPEAIINNLDRLRLDSLQDGYSGFSGSGEMSWSSRNVPGTERLVEYEAMLNELVDGQNTTLLCQYDLNLFDGGLMFDVLKVHPLVLMNGQVIRNTLYRRPNQPEPKATSGDGLSSWVLGKLLLIQSVFDFFNKNNKLAQFVCRGLDGIPGCDACAVDLSGPGQLRRSDESSFAVSNIGVDSDPASIRTLDDWDYPTVIPARTSSRQYGTLYLNVVDSKLFALYEPYLFTVATSIALSLERRWQKSELNREIAKHKETTAQLKSANIRLKDLANTDSLTGLHNSRCFFDTVPRQILQSLRIQQPMVLVMLDINNLKQVNDKLGHNSGDLCLKTFAEISGKILRRSLDKAFRIGGDEFVILMGDCLPEQAESVCARINEKFSELNDFASLAYGMVEIPASLSQETESGDNKWLENIMNAADRQMYLNKQRSKT